jgi:hypothetical protein
MALISMTTEDMAHALRALLVLEAEPDTDKDRLIVNKTAVWRKSRVLDAIQPVLVDPLNVYGMHRRLVSDGYLSADRYTARTDEDGVKTTFKVNRIDSGKCRMFLLDHPKYRMSIARRDDDAE